MVSINDNLVTNIGDSTLLDIVNMDRTTPLQKTFSESDPTGKSQHDLGAKLDSGKIQASLLGMFARALLAVADVGTHGAAKYSRGGWQFVPNAITRYDDAKWRHLLGGYVSPVDFESKKLHAAHEAWNALAKLELILRGELRKGDTII